MYAYASCIQDFLIFTFISFAKKQNEWIPLNFSKSIFLIFFLYVILTDIW